MSASDGTQLPPRPDVVLPRPVVEQHGLSVSMRLEGVESLEPSKRTPAGPTPPDWAERVGWLEDWAPPVDVIRGVQHHADAVRSIAGAASGQAVVLAVEVELVRDPANPHDPNAIRAEIAGAPVGYIGRGLAAHLAPRLDAASCERCRFPGVVCGGAVGDFDLEVFVWLDRPLTDAPDLVPPPGLAASPTWPPYEVLMDEEDAGAGVRREPDIDRFYALDLGIEAAWGEREIADVVEMTRESIELFSAFVARRMTELRGDEPVTHHLNAVRYGGQTLAALGDRDTLLELRAAVAREPALAEFVPAADANLELEGLIGRVLAYVAEHPGVVQSELAQQLGAEKGRVSEACYYAAMAERLERSKSGRSYALTIPS